MTTAAGGVPVLELGQVTKVYPGSPPVRALERVSLAVAGGELVAVAGPSGSGKSTLLHLMGTLDRPTSGTVRITGLDVARMADRELSALRARRIGFIFQQFFLAEQQTVLGNVADGLLYAGDDLLGRDGGVRVAHVGDDPGDGHADAPVGGRDLGPGAGDGDHHHRKQPRPGARGAGDGAGGPVARRVRRGGRRPGGHAALGPGASRSDLRRR